MGKSMAIGAVGSNGLMGELGRAYVHGYANGIISHATGGDFLSGFASGGLGSLAGSAFMSYGGSFAKSTYGQVGFSSLSGGIGAELSGGDFWRGAATGATVGLLNHYMHEIDKLQSKNSRVKVLRKMIEDELLKMEKLTGVKVYSKEAVELLLGTAIQESNLNYRVQLGSGPGRGLFQIEEETYNFIVDKYLKNQKPKVLEYLRKTHVEMSYDDLIMNDRLSIAIARMKYYSLPSSIPSTLEGQANYWKQFYNTIFGAGTTQQYINNWKKYVND